MKYVRKLGVFVVTACLIKCEKNRQGTGSERQGGELAVEVRFPSVVAFANFYARFKKTREGAETNTYLRMVDPSTSQSNDELHSETNKNRTTQRKWVTEDV